MRERIFGSFAALDEQKRQQALARFAVLWPCLEEEVYLTRVASEAGVQVWTTERWLARYRQDGSAGLARPIRYNARTHRSSAASGCQVVFKRQCPIELPVS